ncbi:PAS domain S-box-containing protein [Malonomonas rubra DSM 5091]|uniref:PAS domain S-box-containing protein n=1 Tax=Malonomonas rubra DSM 5091 TaxID=1122189 RepID=A0A1M6IMJ2_MALRU|nr:sigma 54-interacting transcriptional regulator [Malonomonas rubra]SHJ35652.1 PAS domain S-box-containing protein [Malonomonas rubra DSM 5091]
MSPQVLVVDDETTSRNIFSSFLKKDGCQVINASTFDEALAFIDEHSFDLILSDILLDGKNGIELLEYVKKAQPSCPVIMVTGSPSVHSATEAVRLGAYDYLSKPVHGQELTRVSRRALKYKQLADEQQETKANLEAIFRSVQDAIITVDSQFKVLAINDAAQTLCGITKETLGKNLSAHQLCAQKCFDTIAETIAEKHPTSVEHIHCDCKGKRDQVVSLHCSPLYNAKGACYGAVLVVRDNTRLYTLEQSLQGAQSFHKIVGSSPKMQEIYGLIERLADAPTTVLVTGESGTGKELIAAAIHEAGHRKGPLVTVNCAALSENLLESELFGHVKGAFTGAVTDKVGRFVAADGGTIFLDEIGDISAQMQTRLLRVLQEKVVERVGDIKGIPVDVRVVAATNRNLKKRIESGEFREDLFFRLNVVNIDLPPLRNRKTDIPALVDHLIDKLNIRLNRNIQDVSEEVLGILMAYDWPGNIRELEHCIEHAFILCRGTRVEASHLPAELTLVSHEKIPSASSSVDAEAIRSALSKTGGNKAKAARLLGISRRTIYRKIDEFGIDDI